MPLVRRVGRYAVRAFAFQFPLVANRAETEGVVSRGIGTARSRRIASSSRSVHWWFHFGAALSEVIMPAEFYMVGPPQCLVWDEVGLKARARDWAAWPGTPSDDLMHRSQFNLFRDIGAHLYGRSPEALSFAINRIALPNPTPVKPIDPQIVLALEALIARTAQKTLP